MFGIGAGEFIVIILVVLMFFGSDKIPEMARTLGKGIAHLKNATNEIKSEIHKGVDNSGLDMRSLTGGISDEIAKAKEGFTKMVSDSADQSGIQSELEQVREKLLAEESETAKSQGVDIPQAAPSQNDPEITEGPIKRDPNA